ncbi:hypothetical protein, partial [Streptomyces spirodelae]
MPATTEAVETIRTTDAVEAVALDLDTLIAELDTRVSTHELPEGRMHTEACSGLCTVAICN